MFYLIAYTFNTLRNYCLIYISKSEFSDTIHLNYFLEHSMIMGSYWVRVTKIVLKQLFYLFIIVCNLYDI